MVIPTEAQIWAALEEVTDPEIPVISVVDLGIIQEVTRTEEGVRVAVTPTFAGCPALHVIQDDIRAAVIGAGVPPAGVEIAIDLDPPWTSERITEKGRAQLKAIGLAPPERVPAGGGLLALDEIPILDGIVCPFCDSTETRLESPFGPTMCRSLYYCHSCQQPFEKFKAL